MTPRDEKFFAALIEDREENSKILEKASMRGIKRSVVEKYSEQAHFIYELLQNADDAKATRAEFTLHADRLIFKHNGTKKFSISDPAEEDADTASGALGDINAITSIANTNKTSATIGKFGVGFKAVFKYTSTPAIFDPHVAFQIKNFIVPVRLNHDHPARASDETLFEFPFDNKDCAPPKAFKEISEKLPALDCPILFLPHLQEVKFSFGSATGTYKKNKSARTFADDEALKTEAELITLTNSYGEVTEQKLWLFSRADDAGRKYSVGYFLNDKNHLTPVKKYAFCFFSTKHVTNLNFVIHAPFLLNDSREGILAGDPHNETMIEKLAALAADALIYLRDIGREGERLIDDRILKIIPVDESDFDVAADAISFAPFFTVIRKKFRAEKILPTSDDHTIKENAYWADTTRLTEIFPDKQLGKIVGNPNASWVFTTVGERNAGPVTSKYIRSVVNDFINEDKLLKGSIYTLDGRFIEAQPLDWFQKFYEWLAQTADRTAVAKFKPFFLDDKGKATAAFDRWREPLLFLPDDSLNVDYPKIHPALLTNPSIKKFLTQEIGIREPDLKDITKKLTANFIEAQPLDWFEKFYGWLAQSSNRISTAKSKPFFLDDKGNATAAFDAHGKPQLFLPNQINYPTVHPALLANPAVKNFLTEKIGIREPELGDVVEKILQLYENESVTDDAQYFKEIFLYYNQCPNAQVDNYIRKLKAVIYFRRLDGNQARPNVLYFPTTELTEYFAAANHPTELFVDEGFYLNLVGANDRDRLREFFKELGVADEVRYLPIEFNDAQARKLQARGFELPFPHTNYTRTWHEIKIDGSIEILENISDTKDPQKSFLLWRQLVAVNESVGKLEKNLHAHCDYYHYTSKTEAYTPVTVQWLKNSAWLVDKAGNFKKPADMTVSDMANAYDLTSASAKQLIDFLGIPTGRLTAEEQRQIDIGKKLEEAGFTAAEIQKLIDERKNPQPQPSPQPTKKVSSKKISPTPATESTTPPPADEESDADELAPAAVDYRKKLERAQKKRDDEQNQIARLEELQQKVLSAEKYSFAWLKSLLELEILNSREKNSNSKEISISFGRVEFDEGTRRTLILEQPRSYIPQFMEELENISLVLHTAANTTTVEIEVAAVRNYTLRVKLKDNYKLDEMNLDEVVEATISAKNLVFLLEELQKQINALPFPDDYNLRDNLCSDIEFVFGPPGTGKTYTLAEKIIKLMSERDDKKILVLTPTNKAADVLVKKIMELDDAKAYKDWLLRFGTTKDDDVEKSGVFKDKTFDISAARRNVTATTIVRFPYDFFMTGDKRIFLREIHWNYIIIDEASMIMLAQILLPLYKKTPRKFIVAGDPFQIPPVTAIDLWKDENIYTLVGLKSFTAPQTFPHDYRVECLTTQYRSVPAVGEIFSRFAYDGILKHNRAAETQRPLHIDDWLDVESLNIIKFPVKKYESIYRSRRLNGTSSYQIYSALFTFEFVKELSRQLEKNNPAENFSVGIVAPYRAQADVIEKLFAAAEHFERVDVQVGTVHTFQGDECDILFAVFNTPPAISASPEMFLNRLNIINVAISRARDYLFLVMPDDETENVGNLHLVKKVERFFADENGVEFAAQEIEESMFGQRNYIEENSFATGHQNVNVYTLPERHYEIRSEDTAVDVQVH